MEDNPDIDTYDHDDDATRVVAISRPDDLEVVDIADDTDTGTDDEDAGVTPRARLTELQKARAEWIDRIDNVKQSMLKVKVPEGSLPGSQLRVANPNTEEVLTITVPDGAQPGAPIYLTFFAVTVNVPVDYVAGTALDIGNPVTGSRFKVMTPPNVPAGGQFIVTDVFASLTDPDAPLAGADDDGPGAVGGKKSRRKRTKRRRTIGGKKSRKQRKRTTLKGGKRKRRRTRRRR